MSTEFLFFLSYARDDADGDSLIDEFYEDLRREIRRQMGLVKEDAIGFRDTRTIGLGFDWSAEVSHALQSSRTLLCLYSPTYFRRPHCGQEVQVFRLRQQLYLQGKPSITPPVILPVIWVPCENVIPRSLLDLQYDHADFPESYRHFRLRQLKGLARLRDDYQLFLGQLASKVIATATAHVLPSLSGPPQLSTISNAFEASSTFNAGAGDPWHQPSQAARLGKVQLGPYNLTYVLGEGDLPMEKDSLVQALVEVSSTDEVPNARLRCHVSLLLDVS
jgi:hypothetical protein